MTMESMCNLDWEIIISYTVLVAKSVINQTDQRVRKKSTILVGLVIGKFFVGTIIGSGFYHED